MSTQGTVVLFDIDGTLIRTSGAGGRALNHAFHQLFGVEDAFEGVSFVGSTDPQILDDAFSNQLKRSPTEKETATLLQTYLERLPIELDRSAYTINPGIGESVQILLQRPRTALGLATGNIEKAAHVKLVPSGFGDAFSFGGYGSDARCRTELTRRGAERGCEKLGLSMGEATIVVLGDSIYDIRSAKAIGAISVGVCTGWTDREVLAQEDPHHLFEDLSNPKEWIPVVLQSGMGPGEN